MVSRLKAGLQTKKMDGELFQGLIAEAQSYLPSIREGISDFCLEESVVSLKEANRQLHTIK